MEVIKQVQVNIKMNKYKYRMYNVHLVIVISSHDLANAISMVLDPRSFATLWVAHKLLYMFIHVWAYI